MHSTVIPNNVTQQQLAIDYLLVKDFFYSLNWSGKLADQSNLILDMGMKLLTDSKNLTRLELDKIVTGTLLLALARHDLKYSYGGIPRHLKLELYHQICNTQSPKLTFHLNPIYTPEDILLVGKRALEDKTIAFDGTFSQIDDMQALITKSTPFNNQYFEIYDIKSKVIEQKSTN